MPLPASPLHFAIVNGPNLNLLGKRQPEWYGHINFELYVTTLQHNFPELNLSYAQFNNEGDLISYLQKQGFSADGIILNPAGYTHTSIALADTVAAIETPVIEVHLSNTFARETFRHRSFTAPHCKGVIIGCGLNGYWLAIQQLLHLTAKS